MILVALVVVAINVWLFENDPFAWIILLGADALLALFLLSAWRRIAQDEKDAARRSRR